TSRNTSRCSGICLPLRSQSVSLWLFIFFTSRIVPPHRDLFDHYNRNSIRTFAHLYQPFFLLRFLRVRCRFKASIDVAAVILNVIEFAFTRSGAIGVFIVARARTARPHSADCGCYTCFMVCARCAPCDKITLAISTSFHRPSPLFAFHADYQHVNIWFNYFRPQELFMNNCRVSPQWEFLLSASRNSLQSYELSRLSHAS